MMKQAICVGACVVMFVVGASAPAFASTTEKALERLVELNAGSTLGDLSQSLREYADDVGVTYESALYAALEESEASVSAAAPPGVGGIGIMSSPGGGSYNIGAAKNKGDVFVTPAWTGPVNHGHVGVFYATSTIVEAPGLNKKSRSITAANYKVAKGSVKQSVGVTTAKRNASANYAYNNLRNKDYNPNFAINRDDGGRDMNCSQLVWAAYSKGANIDIDSNGGLGVYPYNIKDSSYTTTYRTF